MPSPIVTSPVLGRRGLIVAAASLGVMRSRRASAAADPLRIAYAEAFPPVSFVDGGAMKGILVDILDVVMGERLGLPLSHSGFPWTRAQDYVRDGQCDAFCTNRTEKRAEYVDFGAEPILLMNYVVFYGKSNPKATEIARVSSVGDVRQFVQGDYHGNGFAEVTFKDHKIDWANNLEQVLRKVAAGRNDLAVVPENVGRWTARKAGLGDQLAVATPQIADGSRFFLGIRKSFAGGQALLSQFDMAIANARAAGTLKAVEAKYT